VSPRCFYGNRRKALTSSGLSQAGQKATHTGASCIYRFFGRLPLSRPCPAGCSLSPSKPDETTPGTRCFDPPMAAKSSRHHGRRVRSGGCFPRPRGLVCSPESPPQRTRDARSAGVIVRPVHFPLPGVFRAWHLSPSALSFQLFPHPLENRMRKFGRSTLGRRNCAPCFNLERFQALIQLQLRHNALPCASLPPAGLHPAKLSPPPPLSPRSLVLPRLTFFSVSQLSSLAPPPSAFPPPPHPSSGLFTPSPGFCITCV
jgi:hypothetical protein